MRSTSAMSSPYWAAMELTVSPGWMVYSAGAADSAGTVAGTVTANDGADGAEMFRFLMACRGRWGNRALESGCTGAAVAGSATARADIMTAGMAAVVTATLSRRGLDGAAECGCAPGPCVGVAVIWCFPSSVLGGPNPPVEQIEYCNKRLISVCCCFCC